MYFSYNKPLRIILTVYIYFLNLNINQNALLLSIKFNGLLFKNGYSIRLNHSHSWFNFCILTMYLRERGITT